MYHQYNQDFNQTPVVSITNVDKQGASEFLGSKGWPVGLQNMLINGCERFPIRFFIVDDSGSMGTDDGHRLILQGKQSKLIKCSRWAELVDALRFHANFAESAKAASEFRLLNYGGSPIRVGFGNDNRAGLLQALSAFEISPSGGTPLCFHVNAVTDQIRVLEPQLRANNQKAVLIIATDGESSDGDIATALRPLKALPVWVVIRLCTDEDKIVDYWNRIDEDLELEMDVLDDLRGEAAEVTSVNSWLTYGEPLHRLREFGVPIKEFDLLDERLLTMEQMRTMCSLLLADGNLNSLPHPEVDWIEFFNTVRTHNNQSASMVWCPIRKSMQPWIKLKELQRKYHPGLCSTNCSIS